MQTQIRLRSKRQSGQGLHRLLFWQAFCEFQSWKQNIKRKSLWSIQRSCNWLFKCTNRSNIKGNSRYGQRMFKWQISKMYWTNSDQSGLISVHTAKCQKLMTVRVSVNHLQCSYFVKNIFTFPLRAFKWTSTFEMWFIPSWTNRFKPHPHTRHLSGLMSSPSNNVACLLTFAWRWTRTAMTLSAGIWRFGYSKPYYISDLIQNIWKTSQVRWKLKIDTGLII